MKHLLSLIDTVFWAFVSLIVLCSILASGRSDAPLQLQTSSCPISRDI